MLKNCENTVPPIQYIRRSPARVSDGLFSRIFQIRHLDPMPKCAVSLNENNKDVKKKNPPPEIGGGDLKALPYAFWAFTAA